MAGRSRVQQRRSPPGGRSTDPRSQAAPGEPSSPEALLALQRSAGNQATAAMLARMGNGQEADQAQGGGWGLGAYLYSWLEYFHVVSPQAPATATTDDGTEAGEAPTAPATQPAVTTAQAPVNAQPVNALPAPTAPNPASAPLSPGEKAALRTEARKLEAKLESAADRTVVQAIRNACRLIARALEVDSVSDALYKEVDEAVRAAKDAVEAAQKPAKRSTRSVSSSSEQEATEDAAEEMPVDVRTSGAMGDPATWPHRDVVEREMTRMTSGGVSLGGDGKPVIALGVRAHWQASGTGPRQHFVKVYIDEAVMGGSTRMRAYFRYRVVNGTLVLKLVAIREEHGGVNRTLAGNLDDLIGPDGT